MMHSEGTDTVMVEILAGLAWAAGLNSGDPPVQTARLLPVELYREDKISLGRAAELCEMPIEQFVELAARHNAPLTRVVVWENASTCSSGSVPVVSDSSPLICSRPDRLNLLAELYGQILIPV